MKKDITMEARLREDREGDEIDRFSCTYFAWLG